MGIRKQSPNHFLTAMSPACSLVTNVPQSPDFVSLDGVHDFFPELEMAQSWLHPKSHFFFSDPIESRKPARVPQGKIFRSTTRKSNLKTLPRMLKFPMTKMSTGKSIPQKHDSESEHSILQKDMKNEYNTFVYSLIATYVAGFIAVHATLFAVQSGTVSERIEELVGKSYQGPPMIMPALANAHLVGIPLILSLFCNVHAVLQTNWRAIGVTLMVLYHCYILLDHVAVFWTTQLFETAEFHARFLHCVLFWTLELGSAILGFANGAHWYVLLNIPNHLFFIYSDICGINTMEYFEWGFKPWWLNVAVVHDCLVHALCIHAYMRRYCGKYTHHFTVCLTCAMCIGTFLYHGDKVHFAHLLVHAMYR